MKLVQAKFPTTHAALKYEREFLDQESGIFLDTLNKQVDNRISLKIGSITHWYLL